MKREDMAAVFETVKVLPLRPTDVIVFRASRAISQAQEVMLKEAIREATGHQNILVLSTTGDIEVMRPESRWNPLRWFRG